MAYTSEVIVCEGVPTYNTGWTIGGAAVGFADAMNNDDPTKYLYDSHANDTARSALSSLTGIASRIISVDISWKARIDVAGTSHNTKVGVYLGSSYTWGATRSITADSFQTYTESTLARPGGGSWAPADIPSLEFALDTVTIAGGQVLVRTAVITITYSKGAGFLFGPALRRRR